MRAPPALAGIVTEIGISGKSGQESSSRRADSAAAGF